MSHIDKKIWISYLILIFVLMLLFFTKSHPLYIFDSDDWIFISQTRKAIPLYGVWNPIKVLPETFMSFSSLLAVYVVMPFTNDYITAMALVFGIEIAFFATLYIAFFTYWLFSKMNLKISGASFISFIYLLFHFLIFRKSDTNNIHMFYCENITCYFHYLIPTLLNLTLVLYMDTCFDCWKNKKIITKQVLLVSIYLAIFSNLFSSYLLAVYAGTKILEVFCLYCKKKCSLKAIISECVIYWVILCLWAISLVYELGGERAKSFPDISYIANLKETLWMFFNMRFNLNMFWVILNLMLFFCVMMMAIIKNKKVWERDFNRVIVTMILSWCYLILLSARVGAVYIVRTDILLGLFFWWNVFVLGSLACIIREYENALVIVPLMSYIIFCDINVSDRAFKEPNAAGLNYHIVKQIDDSIISQIKEATLEGNESMELLLPDLGEGKEWIFESQVKRYSESMYKHGLIHYPIETIVITDKKYNMLYGLKEY